MNPIVMKPIGMIHSPYKKSRDIPIQGIFKGNIEAFIELKDEYISGLKDLDQFSHAIIIYYFHQSEKEEMVGRPFLEKKKHGIFAIRSPHRPNHIGFSIVKIQRIVRNEIFFTEVDVLDGTPLLDIKPYVTYFDSRENVYCGWLEKHFRDGKMPEKAIPGNGEGND
jgi:tRNA-Thr(GGU) m(6)t(6)A37 methyltransferase TsaA